MIYLLDTNICIALLKSKERELIRKLRLHSPSDIGLCSIVKAELLYGARHSERVVQNLSLLEKFFSQFESLPFDDLAAEYYGSIRETLAHLGTPVGANDMLVAAIAQANNLVLVTRNQEEFSRIPALKLKFW